MRKFLLLLLATLGMIALTPRPAEADVNFGITFGAPGYYDPYPVYYGPYYGDRYYYYRYHRPYYYHPYHYGYWRPYHYGRYDHGWHRGWRHYHHWDD